MVTIFYGAPAIICKRLVSFDLAQDREPIDVTQDRESIDVTQDRELVERLVERPFYNLCRNIYGLKRDPGGYTMFQHILNRSLFNSSYTMSMASP